jgi:signal transduction histidine kinase
LQIEPAGAGAFPHLTSFPVAATPFGFDLVGGRTIGVRSDQSVRLPLNDFSGALSGYIELSEGASFGSEIIQNVTVALIFAEGIAIVIAALVGWFISRQISRPVLSLTVGAEQMARGDHAARVRVAGRDEFGKLAHTFNEMAEQVEVTIASLRRFVADAAHELHTPLTALHADLELAATDSHESRRLAYIARARTQAHLLELLTNNLLDLSRLESKSRPASFHPVDVTRLVQDLSEVAASRAEQMNQQFKVEAPETPVFVTGDEMQLRRAVINLLDNAIKFTPEGGTVGVAVQRTGSNVNIVVNDTGIGIPADDLPQLFSRFHRGRNANNYPGSGLGLAIIRAIVDGHRGQIEVRSVPGDTRFTMQLPVAS